MQKRPQSPRPPKAEVSEQAGRGADAAARRPSRPNDFPVLEPLLPLISARIIKASPEELDEVIQLSLKEIVQAIGVNRGGLLKVTPEGACKAMVAHAWYEEGVETVSGDLDLSFVFPWHFQQLVVRKQTVALLRVAALPAEAATDRQTFAQMGVQSALNIPLLVGQRVHHIATFNAMRQECTWPEQLVALLRLAGEIFVSALERREILRALELHKARLDLAAAAAGAALWELEEATGEFWMNEYARQLFQFAPGVPVTFADLLVKIHPEDRARAAEVATGAWRSGGESEVEYRLLPGADGSERWLISRGRAKKATAGRSACLAGVTMEITARKQMEQQLQEQFREINQLRELLEQENTLLRLEAGLTEDKHDSLGTSPAMQNVKVLVEQVARTNSTVLIEGETGTGKELIAQAIHQRSDRKKRLMITVNCAALPSALIESELFGREKGAFTGALNRQIGRFELAHESTLFLDEIAEMPLETQAKLLRVLQNGTFERLGSPHNIMVNVRILAATNRNLAEEVEHGRFRSDLFYRLNVFPIRVPPLRERVEDIPPLVWKFISEFGQLMGRKINRVASHDMEMLTAYSWPGNVRELRNVIERAMITSTGSVLDLSRLHLAPASPAEAPVMTIEAVERRHIETTLKLVHGKVKGQGGAAQLLGLNPSTLYSRMRKLNISAKSS